VAVGQEAFVPFAWASDEFRFFGPAAIVDPPGDGSSTDPARIKLVAKQLHDEYRISTCVMDMNRAEDLAGWFQDELGWQVVDRAQTSKPQSEDYERFMQALRQGWLRHSGDDGLRRHALNAVTRLLPDGGAKFGRPSEVRQGGNQDGRVVDALIAAAIVHSYAAEVRGNPEPEIMVSWA
jgi:phage terminase large subunit-like protein